MRWLAMGIVVLVSGSTASASTLEDWFGDGSNSGCTAEATPLEQRILDRGSDGYSYPTPEESAALLAALDALLDGDLAAAGAEAAAASYHVTEFADDVRGRVYHLLEPEGPGNPGHGYLILDPHGNRSILLEAPHVGFDTRTVDFPLEALTSLRPLALLIPGADRYANYDCNGCSTPCSLLPGRDDSDVTRTEGSLFHQMHQRIVDRMLAECRRPLVVQFHGFGSSTQSTAGCGYDFILSDGDGTRVVDPAHLTRTGEHLEQHTNDGTGDGAEAYTWNVASGVGGDCSGLLATLNRQGASTRSAGGRFLHLEMDAEVRAWPDAADRGEVAAALAETRLAAHRLTVRHGVGTEVIVEWDGGLEDEVLYRSPSAGDFCAQSQPFAAPAGSFADEPGPGLVFYRVE